MTNHNFINVNTILHKAETRFKVNQSWLNAFHSFRPNNTEIPNRSNFGTLIILNDDTVDEGMGFETHPHRDMEIISIPLEGDLEHKDSMGYSTVIKSGDIQVMSAGTGIYHSEYNKNNDKKVNFLQIWIVPNKTGVTPRYDQKSLNKAERHNNFQQILSPNADDEGVWIHQNAWFFLGTLDKDFSIQYTLKDKSNGVYAFVLNGDLNINNQTLNNKDGFGIWNIDTIDIKALSQDTELLLMEVPMNV